MRILSQTFFFPKVSFSNVSLVFATPGAIAEFKLSRIQKNKKLLYNTSQWWSSAPKSDEQDQNSEDFRPS
jgi:hypothetical protein